MDEFITLPSRMNEDYFENETFIRKKSIINKPDPKMKKKKIAGSEKSSGDYLRRSEDTKEAQRIADEAKELPHLKTKPIKYLLKN